MRHAPAKGFHYREIYRKPEEYSGISGESASGCCPRRFVDTYDVEPHNGDLTHLMALLLYATQWSETLLPC